MRHFLPYIFLLLSALHVRAQVPTLLNPGFEDTLSTPSGAIPAHWSTSAVGFGFTNDAYEGNRAIQVWNWYYYAKGYLVNGNAVSLGFGGGGGGATNTICALTGHYKYVYGANGGTPDSAEVQLLLFRNPGPTLYDRDTLYWGSTRLGPANSYTPFEVIPSEGPGGATPDSFVVSIISSVNGFCDSSSSNCLYLTVDALSIAVPVGSAVPLNIEAEAGLFPNPSDGLQRVRLPVGTSEARLEIIDLAGRRVASQHISADGQTLDRRELPAGTYTWRLISASTSLGSGRMVLQ